MKTILAVFAVVALLLVVACGGEKAAPVPTVILTPVPTVVPGPAIGPTGVPPPRQTNKSCVHHGSPNEYRGDCAATPKCQDVGGGKFFGACYDSQPPRL